MAKSDCVVIWGTNAVATQVNVMTHATRARKERGAKIVVIDIYDTETMRQADLALRLRPGTDGALACAVMHVLFRDGLADRAYLARYADAPEALEAHLDDARPAMGERDHRPRRRGDRGIRRAGRPQQAHASSASATASRASATARPTCTRRCACRPSPAPGRMRAAAPSTPTAAIFKLDKTLIEGLDARDAERARGSISRASARS